MKTRIFIEAKNEKTSESVFISTLLSILGKSPDTFELVHVNGKDNLRNLKVKFIENTLEGGRNLIVFDADSKDTGDGYDSARKRILSTFGDDVTIDGLFLFPNNQEDGIFEDLLEKLMQKESHKVFIDCFSDYEKCLGDKYVSPDLKGRLYTYMSAQKALTNRQRKALGSGQWLFEDSRFWNLDAEALNPLKMFLNSNV